MKFDDLDSQMRVYETSADFCVLPGIFIVARLDGRNFTKLTKEKGKFEAPFDSRFRDLMIETTKHLMQCGFKVIYGYTESDEKVMKYRCYLILTLTFLEEKSESITQFLQERLQLNLACFLEKLGFLTAVYASFPMKKQ